MAFRGSPSSRDNRHETAFADAFRRAGIHGIDGTGQIVQRPESPAQTVEGPSRVNPGPAVEELQLAQILDIRRALTDGGTCVAAGYIDHRAQIIKVIDQDRRRRVADQARHIVRGVNAGFNGGLRLNHHASERVVQAIVDSTGIGQNGPSVVNQGVVEFYPRDFDGRGNRYEANQALSHIVHGVGRSVGNIDGVPPLHFHINGFNRRDGAKAQLVLTVSEEGVARDRRAFWAIWFKSRSSL